MRVDLMRLLGTSHEWGELRRMLVREPMYTEDIMNAGDHVVFSDSEHPRPWDCRGSARTSSSAMFL